jgi:aminoglycoside/choline kinase family phosphotransferase
MTEIKFEGQVALVTGASRGIGAAIALELAKRGLKVIGTATTDDGAGKISQALSGFPGCGGKNLNVNDAAAAELLAMMHVKAWPARMEAAPGVFHDVPPFDRDAMMIEADLLVDWYVPMVSGGPASEALRAGYHKEWSAILDRLDASAYTLMLRDFHSPNIIWRGDRAGHDRLGIVDFQDALIGPSAYDVASLAMDARVTISPPVEKQTLDAYVAARHAAGAFDEASFLESYAIMAAQRNSKILGIFVRLHKRDGKPDYLKHLPRIRDYLRRALVHPSLAGLRDLYSDNGLLEEREL